MPPTLTCDEVNRFIFSIAPDPKPWHDTEQVYAWGDPRTPCTGVAVAWWPGVDILRQAAAARLNFVVSHEDPIMEMVKLPLLPHRSPTPQTTSLPANRERMRLMVESNLVVHRHHWNVDLAPWGIPNAFIEEMGWADKVVLADRCVRVVELPPTPMAQVVGHLKSRLRIPFVRVTAPSAAHVISRIGIAPGGSGQGWGAVAKYCELDCDTVIVGDMIHGCAKMAQECGVAVLDCFHHATEQPGIRKLAALISTQFPALPVRYFEEPVPWNLM